MAPLRIAAQPGRIHINQRPRLINLLLRTLSKRDIESAKQVVKTKLVGRVKEVCRRMDTQEAGNTPCIATRQSCFQRIGISMFDRPRAHRYRWGDKVYWNAVKNCRILAPGHGSARPAGAGNDYLRDRACPEERCATGLPGEDSAPLRCRRITYCGARSRGRVLPR